MEARHTQPPSKVLHIRNLPYETQEEELIELCAPFGRLVQTKLNVGANRNQAFVEFTDVNHAINMVSYFATSSDPAKVRGKTVYLQYSTRQEIVNSRPLGEGPGNVLLVTLENLAPDIVITLETLHLVFSAFGLVCKIATFEKTSGFQALVQYSDPATADMVRQSLDGRHIPKHLLNDHPNPPMLKISFSQHTDLNVKFQSHRSRDYTNPYLPVAPPTADPNLALLGIKDPNNTPSDGGNVLLCSIENAAYPVNVEALKTVFSPYGTVEKIACFEKNNGWQALIQYSDASSAASGKAALEGHAIYDGGYNRLKIAYSVHRDLNVRANNDKSWDYTLGPGQQPGSNGATAGGYEYAVPAGASPEDHFVVTGSEYEQAHEDMAKAAAAALGQAYGPGGGRGGGPYGAPPGGGRGPPGGYGRGGGYGGGYGGPPPGAPPPGGAGGYGAPPAQYGGYQQRAAPPAGGQRY